MKVRELIAELQTLQPEWEIKVLDNNSGEYLDIKEYEINDTKDDEESGDPTYYYLTVRE